jgi:hypothetical protein
MVASSALVFFGLQDERLVLRLRSIEVAHVACGNHGLYLSAKQFLQARDEVDLELVGIFEDLRVEENLIGFAEAEVEFILVEEFFVCLDTQSATRMEHLGRCAYFCAFELHRDVQSPNEDGVGNARRGSALKKFESQSDNCGREWASAVIAAADVD